VFAIPPLRLQVGTHLSVPTFDQRCYSSCSAVPALWLSALRGACSASSRGVRGCEVSRRFVGARCESNMLRRKVVTARQHARRRRTLAMTYARANPMTSGFIWFVSGHCAQPQLHCLRIRWSLVALWTRLQIGTSLRIILSMLRIRRRHAGRLSVGFAHYDGCQATQPLQRLAPVCSRSGILPARSAKGLSSCTLVNVSCRLRLATRCILGKCSMATEMTSKAGIPDAAPAAVTAKKPPVGPASPLDVQLRAAKVGLVAHFASSDNIVDMSLRRSTCFGAHRRCQQIPAGSELPAESCSSRPCCNDRATAHW
jgi:hypothetical protein